MRSEYLGQGQGGRVSVSAPDRRPRVQRQHLPADAPATANRPHHPRALRPPGSAGAAGFKRWPAAAGGSGALPPAQPGRAIARLKQHRAIATRYDKLAVGYHNWLVLAALLLWLAWAVRQT
jgi:hypothetical protein